MNELVKLATDLAVFCGAVGFISYLVVDSLTTKYKLQLQRITVENNALRQERDKLDKRVKAYESLYRE